MTVWYKDSFEKEAAEFNRAIDELLGAGGTDEQRNNLLNKLQSAYSAARPQMLTDNIWRGLKNTDSWGTLMMAHVKDVIKRNATINGQRTVLPVIKEIVGPRARCPIILQHGSYYTLIAGNTRLMVCKLLEIPPRVILLKI